MNQKQPKKLFGCERHQPLLAFGSLVLPAKSDFAIRKAHNPVVGNRHPVGIAGQLMQDMLRPTEGPLGIDHPVLPVERAQELMEGVLVG